MLTITWSILALHCFPIENDSVDFVSQAKWCCSASDVDAEGNPIAAEDEGWSRFEYDESQPVTPRPDVTEEMMLEWCWANGCDKAAVEADVIAKLYG